MRAARVSTSIETPTGTPIGTTTVARGRRFPRSAVKNITQQMHNSKKNGKVVQATIVSVLGGSDVLVAFM